MILRTFIALSCLCFSISVNAQTGLAPSNDEDDDGILTPEFMTFLTDSGATDGNLKSGFWREHQFSALMSDRRRAVQYDSMKFYDSTRRYLRFYKHEGEYVNGKKEGEWKTYVCYKKRLPLKWRLDSKVNYVAGLRQGWEEVFSKQGEFVGKNYYKDDLQDSTSVFYYGEGKISLTNQYKKGKLHGKGITYKPNGEIQFVITYREGKRTGGIIYSGDGNEPYIFGQHDTFYENGKIKSSSNYEQGELDGLHKTFYPTGNPEKEMNFRRGVLEGSFKAYYDNGQLHYEWNYKDGKLWDVLQYFTKKGKSLSAGTLKGGSGTVMTYNENGKLLSSVSYKNGIQDRMDSDN